MKGNHDDMKSNTDCVRAAIRKIKGFLDRVSVISYHVDRLSMFFVCSQEILDTPGI